MTPQGWMRDIFIRVVLLALIAAVCIAARANIAGQRERIETLQQLAELLTEQNHALADAALAAQTLATEQTKRLIETRQQLDALAYRWESTRNEMDQISQRQQAQARSLAAARADLRELRLGADVLCHWARANAGDERGCGGDAATAAAVATGKPDAAVPATTAAAQ